jgi:hypothetical protein
MEGTTIREYRTRNFRVSFEAIPEDTDPADMIATGDDVADREYAEAVYSGVYPWYSLRVRVSMRGARVMGEGYLGCVDTFNLRDVGAYDVAREAITEARQEIARLRSLNLKAS